MFTKPNGLKDKQTGAYRFPVPLVGEVGPVGCVVSMERSVWDVGFRVYEV